MFTLNNDELPPGHSVSGLGFAARPPPPENDHHPFAQGSSSGGIGMEEVKDDFFAANGHGESEAEIHVPPPDDTSLVDVPLGDDEGTGETKDGTSTCLVDSFDVSEHGAGDDDGEESSSINATAEKARPPKKKQPQDTAPNRRDCSPSLGCKTCRCKLMVALVVVLLALGGGAVAVVLSLDNSGSPGEDIMYTYPTQAPTLSLHPSAAPSVSLRPTTSFRPTVSRVPSQEPSGSAQPTATPGIPVSNPSPSVSTPSPSFSTVPPSSPSPTFGGACEDVPPVLLMYNFTQSDFEAAASNPNREVGQQKKGWFPVEADALGCNIRLANISDVFSLGDFGASSEEFSIQIEKDPVWPGKTLVSGAGTNECGGPQRTSPNETSVLPPVGLVEFDVIVQITPEVGALVCSNPSYIHFSMMAHFISW